MNYMDDESKRCDNPGDITIAREDDDGWGFYIMREVDGGQILSVCSPVVVYNLDLAKEIAKRMVLLHRAGNASGLAGWQDARDASSAGKGDE